MAVLIAGMKSSFARKIEFNGNVFSLLNILTNNITTLFAEMET